MNTKILAPPLPLGQFYGRRYRRALESANPPMGIHHPGFAGQRPLAAQIEVPGQRGKELGVGSAGREGPPYTPTSERHLVSPVLRRRCARGWRAPSLLVDSPFPEAPWPPGRPPPFPRSPPSPPRPTLSRGCFRASHLRLQPSAFTPVSLPRGASSLLPQWGCSGRPAVPEPESSLVSERLLGRWPCAKHPPPAASRGQPISRFGP